MHYSFPFCTPSPPPGPIFHAAGSLVRNRLMPELFSMKRHQWIPIASAAHRPVINNREDRQNTIPPTYPETPKIAVSTKLNNPHKFQRTSQAPSAVLCVVGNCDELAMYNMTSQLNPPTLYAELTPKPTAAMTDSGVTEHIRVCDRRKLQTVGLQASSNKSCQNQRNIEPYPALR